MANSHAEDAAGIAAAIKTLATKEELSESEQRLNAASEALQSKLLKEIEDRDERMRKELKADLEQPVERIRFFGLEFAEVAQAIITGLAVGLAIGFMAFGFVEFISRIP